MAARKPRPAAARRWAARDAAPPVRAYDLLCAALCCGAAVLAACGPLGRWVWIADVVNLFRPYAVIATALVLGACCFSRRRWLMALAGLLLVAELLLLALPALRGDELGRGEAGKGVAAKGGAVLKVITFNCLGSNPNVDTAVTWIRAMRPDILVLEEIPRAWRPKLDSLTDILPNRASALQDTPSDTDVFSRAAMASAEAYRPSPDLRALIHATVVLDGRPLEVFGLHPNTLQTPGEWSDRNAALELAAQWIAQTRRSAPALALGDWNTPPWSPYFHRFLRISGLKAVDPPTWPPMTRVLAAPGGVRLGSSIDHVAATPGVRRLGCETGPQMGSDHAPQICRLQLPTPG